MSEIAPALKSLPLFLGRFLRLLSIALALGALLGQPAEAMQLATGSYTGNGIDNRAITGVGFQPDAVIIKSATAEAAVMRTATMTGDSAKELTAASVLEANKIQSLDADGFTVGTHTQVNSSGVTYHWTAFRDNGAGDFKVASYTGNGADNRSISGVGFQPDYIIVMSGGNRAVQRSSAMSGDKSFLFNGTASLANAIQAFEADGIQVGNDARVNGSGTIYHYAAWKASAGRLSVGSYTGNGADNREITGVGFQPEYVIVKADSAQQGVHRPASLTGDSTLRFVSTANLSDAIQALQADGFQVGTNGVVNAVGTTYFWIAFEANPNKLAITSVNGGVNPTAGTGFSVVIEAQDANGIRQNVSTPTGVSLSLKTGSGTLGGTLTGTIAAGTSQVTISGVTYTKAESGVVLTASRTSGDLLTSADSVPFTVNPGAAAKLAFTTQPGNVTAGSVIPGPPTVSVQDSFGNTVTSSTASITMAIGNNPSGGVLSGTTTKNATSGVASFSDLSLDKAGSGYTLTASATGLTGATSNSFTVNPGAAAKLAFTTQPGNAAAGSPIPAPPTVTVQDSFGNSVTSSTAAITMAIGNNPSGGVLSGATTKNATSGVASFSDLSLDKAGSGYTLTASATGLTGATSSAFTLTATIAGVISRASNGSPVSGALVEALQSGVVKGSATTGASGTYSITGLTAGIYDVRVSASGFATKSEFGIAVTGATTVNLSLDAEAIVYIYDELGRLTGVVDLAGETASYSYDAAGNLLSISHQSSLLVSILGFTPNSGPVGTSVTIFGTGFSTTASQNTVTFNGVAATVASSTATQIVTSVPAGATTGPISVTTPTGSATSGAAFAVTGSTGAPTITGFTPAIGVPGASVTVTGTNFQTTPSNNNVRFNVRQSTVVSALPTTIVSKVPSGATSGRIAVATPLGTAVSSADFFAPPSPYTAADVEDTGRMAVGGSSRTTTINTVNKIALVVFDGTAGQRVSLGMSGVTITASDVSIINPDGTTLAGPKFVDTAGADIDAPLPLLLTGTHTILVDPQSTNTGSMTLTLSQDITGTIAINGPSVNLTIDRPGQNARVTFSGTAGQQVSLGITGAAVPGSSAAILNPDGTVLASRTFSGGPTGAVIDAPPLPVTGAYAILVNPTGTNTGSMTLTLSSGDLTGTITINGPSVNLTIDRPGQNARVTFSGTAGQRANLGMSGVTIAASDVSILNPDGTTLAGPKFVDTTGASLDPPALPVTGTYAITVNPRSTNIGSMTLTLSQDLTGGTIAIDGPSVILTIDRPGQNARVTFGGTGGQQVGLGISGVTIVASDVSILNPDGTTLAGPKFADTTGAAMDPPALPVTGTYTILVDPRSANIGTITLTLSQDLTGGTIAIDGPSVNLTIDRPGQNARLTFSGTIGQQVSLGITGAAVPGSSVSIRNPDGTILASRTFSGGPSGAVVDAPPLPVTGTYTILVSPTGSNTGSMTLTLSQDLTSTIAINGLSVILTIDRPGENARLTFDGTVGQRVSLGMSGVTIAGSDVSVLNPDGTTLAGPKFADIDGAALDAPALPITGTYTILVNPRSTNTGSITLTLSQEITGTVAINGPPLGLVMDRPGQNARLTFDGTIGQQVTVQVGGNTIGTVTVKLLKPDGTSLALITSGALSFSLTPVTLPITDTYTVTIDPIGASTGSINVSVTSP